MTPGRYTELFFLDEATALAAGHRPCAECQRARFNLFREFWAAANPEISGAARPAATLLDAQLHRERLARGAREATYYDTMDSLPDGALVTADGQDAYLVLRRHLLLWTPAGYERPEMQAVQFPVRALTPASVVRALEAGFPAGVHTSAWQAIAMGV